MCGRDLIENDGEYYHPHSANCEIEYNKIFFGKKIEISTEVLNKFKQLIKDNKSEHK